MESSLGGLTFGVEQGQILLPQDPWSARRTRQRDKLQRQYQ